MMMSGITEARNCKTYLSKFGDIDESSEVLEIRAFVVEFSEAVVLRNVTFTKRLQRVDVIGTFIALECILGNSKPTYDGSWHEACW